MQFDNMTENETCLKLFFERTFYIINLYTQKKYLIELKACDT